MLKQVVDDIVKSIQKENWDLSPTEVAKRLYSIAKDITKKTRFKDLEQKQQVTLLEAFAVILLHSSARDITIHILGLNILTLKEIATKARSRPDLLLYLVEKDISLIQVIYAFQTLMEQAVKEKE